MPVMAVYLFAVCVWICVGVLVSKYHGLQDLGFVFPWIYSYSGRQRSNSKLNTKGNSIFFV